MMELSDGVGELRPLFMLPLNTRPKNEVAENGSLPKFERAGAVAVAPVNLSSRDVGRKHVRRKLYSAELGFEILRQAFDRTGLGETRSPSIRTLPLARRAMIRRSTTRSCPIISRLMRR